jgi:hypothetical protein
MHLFPNSSLLDLWFVCIISLVWAGLAAFLTPCPITASPCETVSILIEKAGINGAMASFIPIIPSTAIPIDFKFACNSSAHFLTTAYPYKETKLTIVILTIFLIVIGGIEFLFTVLTHGITLSFYTRICCCFWLGIIVCEINDGGWSG